MDQQLIIQLQAQIGDVLSQFAAVTAAATSMGENIQQQMTAAANASSSAWAAAVASVRAQGNPIIMNNDVFATVGASAKASGAAATTALAGVGNSVKAVVPSVNGLGQTFKTALGVVGIASIGQIVTKLKAFAQDAVKAFTEADSAERQFMNTLEQRGVSTTNALSAASAVAGMAVPAGFEPEVIQQAIGNMTIKMNSGADATLGMSIAMDDARAKGLSLANAVQQVSIAALGSLKALRQFGITTNKDVNGVLKDANTLLREMAANVKGSLATFMASPMGMVATMKVSLQELKETVGGILTTAFAPVAAMVTGFARAISIMAGTSIAAVDPLTQLAITAEKVGSWFYTAALKIQYFYAQWGAGQISVDTKNGVGGFLKSLGGIGPFVEKDSLNAKQTELDRIKQAIATAQGAVNADIIKMQNSTPEERMAEYWKTLEAAMAGVIPDMNDTVAAATKMGAAFQAAFAPLTLLSGNIPQLAKYIGNLSSSFVLRSELKITVNGGDTQSLKDAQWKTNRVVDAAILKANPSPKSMGHDVGWTHAAGGIGAGLSFKTGGG